MVRETTNLQSSQVLMIPLERLPLVPLPRGVVVRTPSPAQHLPINDAPSVRSLNTSVQVNAVPSANGAVEVQYLSTYAQPATSVERFVPSPETSLATRTYADSVYRLCLESTPFVLLTRHLACKKNPSMLLVTCLHLRRRTDQFRAASTGTKTDPVFDWQWPAVSSQHRKLPNLALHAGSSAVDSYGDGLDLAVALSRLTLGLIPTLQRVSSLEISTNLDFYHYTAIVIYALSNGHILLQDDGGDFQKVFEFLFGQVPRTVLTTFLRRDCSNMRAAWEELFDKLRYVLHIDHLKKPCRDLIELGINYDWIDIGRMGNASLYYAVSIDCTDLVRTLLIKGCRPDTSSRLGLNNGTYHCSAIVAALKKNNLHCAKLLIEHCDVNRVMHYYFYLESMDCTTNFSLFVGAYRNDDECHIQALELFLKNNADVDAHFPNPFGYRYYEWDRFCNKNDTYKEWQISVLEYCFYFNRLLFKRLRPYSKTRPSQMTRVGVLGALEVGLHSLRDYLKDVRPVDPDAKERCLQFILAEQFFTESAHSSDQISMDPNVSLALLELGVDPTFPLVKSPPDVAYGVIRQIELAEDHGTRKGWMNVLDLLIGKNASIGSKALASAVRSGNTNLLQYLISCTANIAEQGNEALATAANRNDFQAVDLLLLAGVDINSCVQRDEENLTILAFAISTSMPSHWKVSVASYRMMKYLIENGAKLMVIPDDCHPCHFLGFLLRKTPSGCELAQKVQYIVESIIEFRHPSTPSEGLLEACLWGRSDEERFTVFEQLLQQGAKVCPGASLAPLIWRGGRQQLIQDLIRSGADIHAYSSLSNTFAVSPLQAAARIGDEKLVQQLLEMGAEVDGKPLPSGADTALQSVCGWSTLTSEENSRRLRIIKMLLEHGAEVNASPGGTSGATALQIVAFEGFLDVMVVLLSHGANVNAASKDGRFALDIAAFCGRIDIAKFLLNANGVSGWPGITGYDGAIRLARGYQHFALADLIVKHAEDNSSLGIPNPLLPCGQKQKREDSEYRSDFESWFLG